MYWILIYLWTERLRYIIRIKNINYIRYHHRARNSIFFPGALRAPAPKKPRRAKSKFGGPNMHVYVGGSRNWEAIWAIWKSGGQWPLGPREFRALPSWRRKFNLIVTKRFNSMGFKTVSDTFLYFINHIIFFLCPLTWREVTYSFAFEKVDNCTAEPMVTRGTAPLTPRHRPVHKIWSLIN